MKVIEWTVGIENGFGVSLGKSGKFLKKYLSDDLYEKVLPTYSNCEPEENWKSLLLLTKIFQQTSNFIAEKLRFCINKIEEQNTMSYLKDQCDEQKNYRYNIALPKLWHDVAPFSPLGVFTAYTTNNSC